MYCSGVGPSPDSATPFQQNRSGEFGHSKGQKHPNAAGEQRGPHPSSKAASRRYNFAIAKGFSVGIIEERIRSSNNPRIDARHNKRRRPRLTGFIPLHTRLIRTIETSHPIRGI